uniref:Uncharacterized protein n=1 Tax=Anguilla anguilla TaxID=7936 RepID=A0A0E9Q9Z6_ANGAN
MVSPSCVQPILQEIVISTEPKFLSQT